METKRTRQVRGHSLPGMAQAAQARLALMSDRSLRAKGWKRLSHEGAGKMPVTVGPCGAVAFGSSDQAVAGSASFADATLNKTGGRCP